MWLLMVFLNSIRCFAIAVRLRQHYEPRVTSKHSNKNMSLGILYMARQIIRMLGTFIKQHPSIIPINKTANDKWDTKLKTTQQSKKAALNFLPFPKRYCNWFTQPPCFVMKAYNALKSPPPRRYTRQTMASDRFNHHQQWSSSGAAYPTHRTGSKPTSRSL
jgi:hypothetical protein